MARRIREVVYDDDVVVSEPAPTRRVVTERRVGGGYGYATNPIALVMAVALALFILIMVLQLD